MLVIIAAYDTNDPVAINAPPTADVVNATASYTPITPAVTPAPTPIPAANGIATIANPAVPTLIADTAAIGNTQSFKTFIVSYEATLALIVK